MAAGAPGRGDAPSGVDKSIAEGFPHQLLQLNGGRQGRGGLTFRQRQTSKPEARISTKTAEKYWSFVSRFLQWCVDEGHLDVNPGTGLRIEIAKEDAFHSPDPFTAAELGRLIETPIFAGMQSVRRPAVPGAVHTQTGHLWFALLAMYTGTRAEELVQLLTTDFDFAADVPIIRIREVNERGQRVKRLKTPTAMRDVPVAPILLDFGLRKFVTDRLKRWGEVPLLQELASASPDRPSDAATKF